VDRSYDTIFAINQLFEIGGKRGSRKASAQAGFEAARAQFLDAKRTLDLGITRDMSPWLRRRKRAGAAAISGDIARGS